MKEDKNQIQINWDQVKNLMKAGMGAPSIAEKLGFSDQTLYRRCKTETGMEFVELRTKMMDIGSDLLIAKGYEMAVNGDKTMLIFYLKNRAGFADHVKIDGDAGENLIKQYEQLISKTKQAKARLYSDPSRTKRKAKD